MREGVIVEMGESEYRWLEAGLRRMSLFAALDRKVLAGILPYMTLLEFPKGGSVCREGESGDGLYLIYSGAVEVAKKGWDAPVAVLRSGEFFGETALLFGQPCAATASAVKPSRLFALRAADFGRSLERNPSMGRTLRRAAAAFRRELARA